MKIKSTLAIASLLISNLCTANQLLETKENQCIEHANGIEAKLSCLHNISDVKEVTGNKYLPNDVKQYELNIEQMVNKERPELGTFKQRLVLLHRDENEPMVLQTSGYQIFRVAQTAITSVFETNQLQIEHRFFADSTPENKDWSQLNIKQSADDFHNVTTTFKKIYNKSWVGTGASKGGMTSTYHRFFYPHDLNGTVADVAPLSFSTSDQRYNDFVNNVGGEYYASCRQAWAEMQTALLSNRDLFTPRIQGEYNQLGSVDVAFEHAIIESAFTFWQYGNPDDSETGCPAIPTNGDLQDIYDFVSKHASVRFYGDADIARFQPYYYQAGSELGAPDNLKTHLEHLTWYEYKISQYTPKGVELNYSNAHMRAIDKWVRNYADNIMFIYGEFDPWTAGEYPLSETGKSISKFYVPKANHGAKFTALSASDKQKATEILSNWLNKTPPTEDQNSLVKNFKSLDKEIHLEELEFEVRKAEKLL